jgi:hypothetical protein
VLLIPSIGRSTAAATMTASTTNPAMILFVVIAGHSWRASSIWVGQRLVVLK